MDKSTVDFGKMLETSTTGCVKHPGRCGSGAEEQINRRTEEQINRRTDEQKNG